METEEKKNNENICCTSGMDKGKMAEMMEKCRENVGQTSILCKCMSRCKWCPLIPVIFGIILLLLGHYLDPHIIRILWMIASGFIVLMGIFVFIMMGLFSRKQNCPA